MPRWTRLRGRSRGDTWQKFFSVQLFGPGHCSRATNTRTSNLRIMCYKPAWFLLKQKHLKALPIQHDSIWYTYNHTDIWYIYIQGYIWYMIYMIYIYTDDTNKNKNNTLRIAIIIKSLRVIASNSPRILPRSPAEEWTQDVPVVKGEDLIRTSRLAIPRQIWILNGTWMVLSWSVFLCTIDVGELLWYHAFGCKNFVQN